MASVLLTAAGAAIPGVGPFGAIAGAWIGSYIDNKFIFPPDDIEGTRLSDFQLQSAAEGSPVNYCMGPENRMSGTIIWISDLIEERHTEEVGGKGGPGSNVVSYVYYVNVAVAVCQGEIVQVESIWADGKLLYQRDPDISYTSNQISLSNPDEEIIAQMSYARSCRVSSTASGPDLSKLWPGMETVMSGWANGVNNTTYLCTNSFKTSSGTSHCDLFRLTGAINIAEGAGPNVTISQTGVPNIRPGKATEITFYTGTSSQVADPLIEAAQGTGFVPGFRGIAYVVIENLALADYGNRMPQLTFFVKGHSASFKVASAISNLVERTGLVGADFDVTAVTDTNFKGMCISKPESTQRSLQSILRAYDILIRESEGKLVFVSRSGLTSDTITATDLAAHSPDADTEYPVAIADMMGLDVPQEVDVQYIDPATDYQKANQREARVDAPIGNMHALQLPIVLTGDQAREIAKRELWTLWMQRRSMQLQLPPSYIRVQENDLISVTVESEAYTVLTKRVSRGRNGILEIEGVIEDVSTATQTAVSDDWESKASEAALVPAAINLQVIDVTALTETENDHAGYHLAACMFDRNIVHGGVLVYISVDDVSFNLVGSLPAESVIGYGDSSTLEENPEGFWDLESYIDVTLYEGELSTKTDMQVLNGANRALVGNEIIAFKTATLVGTNEYRLTNLLRGLRSTHEIITDGSHSRVERFVLLNSPAIYFRNISSGSHGVHHYFRAVAVGGAVADADSLDVQTNLVNIEPFAPCQITGSRDASNNLTINWIRCGRSFVRLFGIATMPLREAVEKYAVEIFDNGSVVRTILVTGATTTTYTATQQDDDGLIPGDPVHVRISQYSDFTGLGRSRDPTI
jgi:hypothetical protein